MEKITGIGFIDKFIDKRGLSWCIRVFGYVVIISGCLDLIAFVTFPLWKEQFLSRWRSDNLPLMLPLYNSYKYIFYAPIKIITGIGLLRFKQWGRRLLIFSYAYYIVELILSKTYEVLVILPKYPKFHAQNKLFWSIVSLLILFFVFYFFARPKVKEQFR